jgi:hypothetical protein
MYSIVVAKDGVKEEDLIQRRAADNYRGIARLTLDTIYFLSNW